MPTVDTKRQDGVLPCLWRLTYYSLQNRVAEKRLSQGQKTR